MQLWGKVFLQTHYKCKECENLSGAQFINNTTCHNTAGFSAGSHLLEHGGGPTEQVGHDNKYESDDKTVWSNDESNEPSYEPIEFELNPTEHVNTIHKETHWIAHSTYKKQQNIMKRQSINIVFNYSSIVLTDAMTRLLNRGFNFCILPMKLDMTQLLVDLKRFERSVVWQEFWYGREFEKPYVAPIFKTKKTNFPKNYSVPKGVHTFVRSVRSELCDPKNRNKAICNIPKDEIEALGELIKLQRDRKITIKPCDKGAGTIILDFEDFMRACESHLKSQQSDKKGNVHNYYIKVDNPTLEDAKY